MLRTAIVILKWFVDDKVLHAALDGELINEDSVECRPEKVPNAFLDENVDVFLARKYFMEDAWMVVMDVVERKKEKSIWICNVCQHDLHSEPSVVCESCLTWFHFRCTGLTKHPKRKNWFCRDCHLTQAAS